MSTLLISTLDRTVALFETDPFLEAARQIPFWIAAAISTVIYGFWSTKFRTIRSPMFIAFVIFTCGFIGLSTIQPSNNFSAMAFAALAGLGYGAPLILIISGAQLSTPHHLIATATAAMTCSRAIAVTVFTAIFSAAVGALLQKYIPEYVAKAALQAGLPKSAIEAFVKALASDNSAALEGVKGVNVQIINSGVHALKQAYADGYRVVYIIAVPFGVVACIASLFLGDLTKAMNYGVDAPMENLHAKRHSQASKVPDI